MSWQPWLEIFISWFPMLLLIGVWIFFMRQFRKQHGSGQTQQFRADLLVEQRRHNEMLEKLLAQHDARLRKLEETRISN